MSYNGMTDLKKVFSFLQIELLATRPTKLPFDPPNSSASMERLSYENTNGRLSSSDRMSNMSNSDRMSNRMSGQSDDMSYNTDTLRAHGRNSPRCSSTGSLSQRSTATIGINW